MIPVINAQAPEKRAYHPLGWLDVHSIFYTIQGEGPHVGTPAVFVRLAGCNLQCPGCDTRYTDIRRLMDIENVGDAIRRAWIAPYMPSEILSRRSGRGVPLVVITGGEPFRQNLHGLVKYLLGEGYQVQIETNGTIWDEGFERNPMLAALDSGRLMIVCSPKAPKVAIPDTHIAAFKYVLSSLAVDESDGLPTSVLGLPAAPYRPPMNGLWTGDIYVQPADSAHPNEGERLAYNKANLHAAMDSAMRFNYRLCIQTHKIIGVE